MFYLGFHSTCGKRNRILPSPSPNLQKIAHGDAEDYSQYPEPMSYIAEPCSPLSYASGVSPCSQRQNLTPWNSLASVFVP